MAPEAEEEFEARITAALRERNLVGISEALADHETSDIVTVLEREDAEDRALMYRMLRRDQALEVFERLDPSMRAELFSGLRTQDIADVFEDLDPDDRAQLVDELPAGVASHLMRGLSGHERDMTMTILGYPKSSVGRFMTPEYVRLQPQFTVGDALTLVRRRGKDVKEVYTLPVTDSEKRVLGAVELRELILAQSDARVSDLMTDVLSLPASDDAETSARAMLDEHSYMSPVIDGEGRLVGILTFDDASRITEMAESVDAARQGASEPLGRPYLATPVLGIVRSRVVWLLVLAVSALLTVQVLDIFEATLSQIVTLALFIPLLTGTAGNTGAQAATTVTRALAMGDVRTQDVLAVAWRELRVGILLGGLLGVLGFAIGSLAFGIQLGAVLGITLVAICTLAACVGGVMPMLARALRADPAVFSTPFISTFCDATSLIIYFLVAKSILGV